MSTRATYQFTGQFGFKVTFYIHSDGYPAWAHRYFHNAITNAAKAKGGLAEAFFRNNPEAEFTAGHDAHGDTEFRYTVQLDDNGRARDLRVEARNWTATDDSWKGVYFGSLDWFINDQLMGDGKDYNSQGHYPVLEPVIRVSAYGGSYQLTTRSKLLALIASKKEELAAYAAKFPQCVGNINGMASSIELLEKALSEAVDITEARL